MTDRARFGPIPFICGNSRRLDREYQVTDLSSRQADRSTPSFTRETPTPAVRSRVRDAIYLDYAATTPVDSKVARAMGGFLTADGIFGNPASVTHGIGRTAMEAVESARRDVAALLSARPEEIVWTSGATESINLALKGAAQARRDSGAHVVVSTLEHKAVLDSAAWLETQGVSVGYAEPDGNGAISPENLASALRPDTILVSLMHVNNETGTVTDIGAIGRLVRRHGALFHVDAAQSAARLPLDDVIAEADLVSISAHKMYGPKGIGALCVRGRLGAELVPQMHGGGHELGLRSGTLPTHQTAGMGHAARLVRKRRAADAKRVRELDDRFLAHIGEIDGAEINGDRRHRVPGILNVYFPDVEAESLMLALGDIAISSGSACAAADIEPSHVLLALGYDAERALSSVRFSFGRFTTTREIDRAGKSVRDTVPTLRRIAR